MLLDLLTVAVLLFVGVRLLRVARLVVDPGPARDRARLIIGGLRPRHFVRALPVITVVIVAASLLLLVPPLRFGWWTAIGGQGNPAIGATDRTAGTPLEWLLPLGFLVLLVPGLPLLAEGEERMFRLGSEHRSGAQRTAWALRFGLVHALIGIPIGVALALSIGGGYFTWAYLRAYAAGGREAGVLESTRSHTAYNLVIAVVVLVALALVAAA